MTSKEDQNFNLLHDARLINISEGVLFPLLKQREENQIALLCAKFDGGDSNILTDVAKLSAFREITRELKRIQTKGHQASEEINELSR